MDFSDVVRFHGHACPGLALGFRAAQAALGALGRKRSADEELVAIVENNSCAVDAIQVMLGCTFGKGNLIFRDYGKQVYTVLQRPSAEAVRLAVIWEAPPERPEEKAAWEKYAAGSRDPDIVRVVHARKGAKVQAVLAADEEALFRISSMMVALPEPARIYPSLRCGRCGEKVMAPRAREREGQVLCIPCAEESS
ncbi:MAG: FmdE family protein [Desulfobacteraceae bacterium]|nr:FmdE family protein [Desulfobacteraceae bacterium]